MKKTVELTDFDILGILKIENTCDITGIEKYITPVFEDNDEPIYYFSRSKEYYNVKTLTELSDERENLKNLLNNRNKDKRNFVILENMLNCSAKVYFKKFEEYLTNPNNEKTKKEFLTAKNCMLEDTKNLITILSGEGLIKITKSQKLPTGRQNCAKRAIEMDNKALLYIFCKALEFKKIDPKNIQILTPGYGSIYIGPFLNALHGYDFTNLFKSKYINESNGNNNAYKLKNIISNDKIFCPHKKIILLDDNVGTGTTIKEIENLLQDNNLSVYQSGAIQYNWRNYYKVSVGEKQDISRFRIQDLDIITPFNYAGHKLYEHAIDELHSSGKDYEKYLKSKSYMKDDYSDLKGCILRGIIAAQNTGIDILGNNNFNPSVPLINPYKNEIVELSTKKIKWIRKLYKITTQIENTHNNEKQISKTH